MRPSIRRGLAAALVAALAGRAAAQDPPELPEEAARRAAVAHAHETYQEALRALEAYGRGAPVSGERARQVAYDLLLAPVRPTERAQRRRPRLHLDHAHEELTRFREAILARLRGLAPDRHPPQVEAPPAEPAPTGTLTPRVIDVQDLVFAPEDHVAPNTGLGAGLDPSGAHDDPGSAYTSTGLDAYALMELIEAEVEHEEGSIEYSGGRLVTRLAAPALERLRALLAQLRRDRGGLVDLEVRVYRLDAATFAALRAEASALSDEAEARLAAGDGATLLASHHVLAHDGQRVHVWRGRSRSYLADLEINQTGVIPVRNPQIAVMNEGLVVEARPIVDRARGRVLVDVALSLSRLDGPVEVQKLQELELELPSLKIARTTASGSVPLGRGALLGGVLATAGQAEDALTCVVYVRPRLTRSTPSRRR